VDALFMQQLVNGIRNRALSASAQTGEPQDGPAVAVEFLAVLASHCMSMPSDVCCFLFGHYPIVSDDFPNLPGSLEAPAN
jgi:hypothetical protein